MIKFCWCVMSCLIGARTFSDKAQNRRLSSSSCKIPRKESQRSAGDIWIVALFLKLAQQILQHKFCLREQIPCCLDSSDLLIGFAGTINCSCAEGPQGPSLAWDVWIYFIYLLLFFSSVWYVWCFCVFFLDSSLSWDCLPNQEINLNVFVKQILSQWVSLMRCPT